MAQTMSRRPVLTRTMVLGAGLLVAATLALVTAGPRTPVDPGLSGVAALQSRDIRFADRADGGVIELKHRSN